jgi:hypothetical protein
VRKLALMTTMALAAIAMTATSASAATLVKNAAGIPCPAVSPAINKASPPVAYKAGAPLQGVRPGPYQSGGCTVHMTSQFNLGMTHNYLSTNCAVHFDLHVASDGWGYADNFVWPSGGCPGELVSWSSPGGSRVVMPAEVRPTMGGQTLYTAYNANTDFNIEMFAQRVYNGTTLDQNNFVSFDLSSPTTLTGQLQTAQSPFGASFRNGTWTGSAGLIVTH